MRSLVVAACAASAAGAQGSISGEVVVGGQPLPYATVAVVSLGRQLLTTESGHFRLTNLPSGDVHLRLKRIGFAPKDTTVTLTDSVHLRIEMTRLVIQLPEMVVSGKCTDVTPREPMPGFLAQLMGQVVLNAQAMALLVAQRPFHVRTENANGLLDRNQVFSVTRVDTTIRGPLPATPYKPGSVLSRLTSGPYKGSWGVRLPELPDIADTAFTNNHCFRYAGRTAIAGDSVIQVDFEPVPRLNQEVDLSGSLYLTVGGYHLVASFTRLNRMPAAQARAGLEEYFNDARYTEVVPGVPVIESWELVNRYRADSRPRFVQRGRRIAVVWKDST
jgi:hypothetical protein